MLSCVIEGGNDGVAAWRVGISEATPVRISWSCVWVETLRSAGKPEINVAEEGWASGVDVVVETAVMRQVVKRL